MFPAYAGMNRYTISGAAGLGHVPRICGDEPKLSDVAPAAA